MLTASGRNKKEQTLPIKIVFSIWIVFTLQCIANTAHAYRLPPYSIIDTDRGIPAEEVLIRYESQANDVATQVGIQRLKEHRINRKIRLTFSERKSAAKYKSLQTPADFWRKVVNLKTSLINLHGNAPPALAVAEADAIAKIVIERIYVLSQRFKIFGSALLQNFLINRGIKKEGFCYHYVNDLKNALSNQSWSVFEMHWGEAWAGTFKENNSLVITAKGAPFDSGIAIDAWRTAGRPFWTQVTGDRFPWVELKEELPVGR